MLGEYSPYTLSSMTARFFSILAALLLSASVAAQNTDWPKDLANRLQGKIMTLRTPSAADHLKFDTGGNVVGNLETGTWAMDSTIHVVKVNISEQQLTIRGKRLVEVYFDGELKAAQSSDPVELTLARRPGGTGIDVDRALQRVFFAANESIPRKPPPGPEQFDDANFEHSTDKPIKYRKKGTSEWKLPPEIEEAVVIGRLENNDPIYAITKAVKPPKALKDPEPSYLHGARTPGMALLRVVINEKGLIHSVSAVKGERDFQLAALAVLRGWRFQPATLDGHAVDCAVNMEFIFR